MPRTFTQFSQAFAAVLLLACGEDGAGSELGQLGGAPTDSGLGGEAEAGGSVPEAAPGPTDVSTDPPHDAYPIDPNGPPPDCVLPCVWEVMKRCPGPQPGQACVVDHLSTPYGSGVQCCPLDQPAPAGPVLCDDESWVTGSTSLGAYKDGEPCWWRSVEETRPYSPPGHPPYDPTAALSTWYVPDESTGQPLRIATLVPANLRFSYGIIGQGACYADDEVVFTTYMDATAEHCRQWYPDCDVPGICPLPRAWRDESDAGPADATTGGTDSALPASDAANTPEATDAAASD